MKGGVPLLSITGSGRDGTNAWATYAAHTPIAKAELNYTRDTGRWQDRKWESVAANQTDGRVTVGLPEGTRVYYFNLVDQRGCVVSTEHEECESR